MPGIAKKPFEVGQSNPPGVVREVVENAVLISFNNEKIMFFIVTVGYKVQIKMQLIPQAGPQDACPRRTHVLVTGSK